MEWTKIAEGHWVGDGLYHVVDGDLTDPCTKCKATGRRGRGRCGHCYGLGTNRRRFDIPLIDGILSTIKSFLPPSLEAAREMQEARQRPDTVVQFSPQGRYCREEIEQVRKMCSS